MFDIHTNTYGNVASMCRHLKYSLNYTDAHNVDEDMLTISMYGDPWYYGTLAGITHRDVDNAPANVYDIVASLKT